MCDGGDAGAACSRGPDLGAAVDAGPAGPVARGRADHTASTTSTTALLPGTGRCRPRTRWRPVAVRAPQFEDGATSTGLRRRTRLLRTGRRPAAASTTHDAAVRHRHLVQDGMTDNADRLGIDLGEAQGVVLSHWPRSDHGQRPRRASPPGAPLADDRHPRRVDVAAGWRSPAPTHSSCPTLSRRALEDEGFAVVERRAAVRCWWTGACWSRGEVDRTTDVRAWDAARAPGVGRGEPGRHDPLVLDDQALVGARPRPRRCSSAHRLRPRRSRQRCVRHAMRLTGVGRAARPRRRDSHLERPVLRAEHRCPTVQALVELRPDLLRARRTAPGGGRSTRCGRRPARCLGQGSHPARRDTLA